MDDNLQDRGRSLQKLLQKGKVEPLKETKSIRSQDKRDRGLKSWNPVEKIRQDCDSSTPSSPSRNYQKPWPNSKAPRVDELVKHMSNVPGYLQRMEQGDVQQKALNFGVVDWGRLEKWAYDQKHDVPRRNRNSPSSGYTSSSFSTFGSSTRSCQSNGSSPAQRRRSTSRNSHEGRKTKIMEDDKSRHVVFHDSRNSPLHTSDSHHHRRSVADCVSSPGRRGHRHEHGKRKDAHRKIVADCMPPTSESSFSSPTSDGYGTAVDHTVEKLQHSRRSREPEKSNSRKQQSCNRSLNFTKDSPQDQELELSKNTEQVWHHCEESVSRRFSNVESTTFEDRRTVRVEQKSFSGSLFPEHIQFIDTSSPVPNSCPLFITDPIDEPVRASIPASKIGVPVLKLKGNCEKHKQVTKEPIVRNVDSKGQHDSEASTEMGSVIPSNRYSTTGLNWMKRDTCLRKDSPIRERKCAESANNSLGDKDTADNRSRQSPLRRILDPFRKSKSNISRPTLPSAIPNAHEPRLADTSKRVMQESTRRIRPSKSIAATKDFSPSRENGSLNSSNQATISSDVTLQQERHTPSGRRALLQLTWKSDTPLLVLTSDDNHVLAATLQKTSISEKDNTEFIYTITSVHEVEKKIGMWIAYGNKSRKHRLVSNIVGQLKVSTSKLIGPSSKGHFALKQFVLIGPELMQESCEPLSSSSNSELAAILVKTTKEGTITTLGDVLTSDCRDSSKMNTLEEKTSNCHEEGFQIEQSITALLPVKAHGLPEAGEPSPLIERWKSGGVCDCGGWDEGCTPTVLVDEVQQNKSSDATHSCSAMDGTDQIKLHVQGRAREQRHAFNMIGYKEGVYAVEFSTTIAMLQAFAICIATLHSTKLSNRSSAHEPLEATTFGEHIFSDNTRTTSAATEGGAPTSYVPHHPPLSPVGRA